MNSDDVRSRGLHPKYIVTRTDGDPRGEHKECVYFVLDLECDEHAIAAIRAYAKSCKKEKPELAADLLAVVNNKPQRCGCREASCPHSLGRAFSPDGHAEMAEHIIATNLERMGENEEP